MRRQLKRIIENHIKSSKLLALVNGDVTSIDPLEIMIDTKLIIPSEALLVPESMTQMELPLYHSNGNGSTDHAFTEEPVILRKGLAVGDKVLLLRISKGQQYVVLDRLVQL